MKKIHALRCFCFVALWLCGCAGSAIPPGEYSTLASPEEAYEFAKKSVARDDPEAFYYCLSELTKSRFSKSELKLGWSLAGSFFYLFLDSKLKEGGVEAPAPDFRRPDTAKVTLESHDIEASFLLLEEEGKWRLVFPSPYPMPDARRIKAKIRIPWRVAGRRDRQETPEAWYKIPGRTYEFRASEKFGLPWRSRECPSGSGRIRLDRRSDGYEYSPPRSPQWRTETLE